MLKQKNAIWKVNSISQSRWLFSNLLKIFLNMSRVRNKFILTYQNALAHYTLFPEYDCTNDDLELWLLSEVEDRFFTLIEDQSEKQVKIMNFNVSE